MNVKILNVLLALFLFFGTVETAQACPIPGKENGFMLFKFPGSIHELLSLVNEHFAIAKKYPNILSLQAAKAYQAWAARIDFFEAGNAVWTCQGDLYSYNSNQIDPKLNAIWVMDVTTGQMGWADATEFFKSVHTVPQLSVNRR